MNLQSSETGKNASATGLRRQFLMRAGLVAVVLLGVAAFGGLYFLRSRIRQEADDRLVDGARQSAILVDRLLDERTRQVAAISLAPAVVRAAMDGGARTTQQGFTSIDISTLEARNKAKPIGDVDAGTASYLRTLLQPLDIAEIIVTDDRGYNAVVTGSKDFVQHDEAWWNQAWTNGTYRAAVVAYDSSLRATIVEQARVVNSGTRKVGVIKAKFQLSSLDSALAAGSGDRASGMRVTLLDSTGLVRASSVAESRGRQFVDSGHTNEIERQIAGEAFSYGGGDSVFRAAIAPAHDGEWRVVAYMPERDAFASYRTARNLLIGALVGAGLLLLGLLTLGGRYIEARITQPAAELAAAAEAVAAGDLSTTVSTDGANDEIGRLSRAIAAMITELRRLVAAMNDSAGDTSNMAAEITASSEEMAASAGQIAHTASDLSQQANVMADTIQSLAGASEDLVKLSSNLDHGAKEGVARNTTLRQLSLQNRARLDDSSRALNALATDTEASRASIEQLAAASEEVRTFVTLVQKLARQSKLLALNAAMEAARAGEHGHGFAVVAEEVRRLAAMSSDAAERTERVVHGVLQGVAQSRSSVERTVVTVREVQTATQDGSRSFGEIETALTDAERWTGTIQQAAESADTLVRQVREKLDTLAGGTESFAAAMEEVAASSQEQSASTEEIAAAAATLATSAERLTRLVTNLRVEMTSEFSTRTVPPPPVRAPDTTIAKRQSRPSRAKV